jgi:hypothetical protein
MTPKAESSKTLADTLETLFLTYQKLQAECFKVIAKPLRKVCAFLEKVMEFWL